MRRIVLIAAALLSLALPAAAQAAGLTSTSPFSVGVPQSSGAPATTATTSTIAASGSTSTSTAGSFSTIAIVAIVAGVILVMVAIVAFVMRDSRRTARQLGLSKSNPNSSKLGDGHHQGSKATPKGRKQLSAAEKKRRKRGRAPRRR